MSQTQEAYEPQQQSQPTQMISQLQAVPGGVLVATAWGNVAFNVFITHDQFIDFARQYIKAQAAQKTQTLALLRPGKQA